MKAFVTFLGMVVLCLLATVAPVSAQTIGASLQGTVTDASGAAVAGAKITVKNTGTGATTEVTSDDGGRYSVPVLQPGNYEARITAQGFQSLLQQGITLEIGQQAVLNLTLQPGQIESTITVEADAAPIQLANAAVSGVVTDKQIRDLPINGRSFEQLAILQIGVTQAAFAGNDVVGGRSPKITVNGARPEMNNFILDGTDIANVYNKTPGSVAGVLLGVDAIREFQVLTNAYSAEYGRSAGGVVNAVTRSGENRYTGTIFHFHRNSALDARNFFNPTSQPKPSFKRNQFGATFGGPIVKDKTFFFGAFEGLIERLGVIGVANVPDAASRAQATPLMQRYLQAYFPLPNGRSLGGGIAQFLFTRTQPTDEYYYQIRLDHRFSDKSSMFGRYTYDNADVDRQPVTRPPIVFTKERSRNQYVTIEHQYTFTPTLINVARAGFSRSTAEADNNRTVDIPRDLWFTPDNPGFISAGFITEVGGDFRIPRLDRQNNFQLSDTLVWTRGRHEMRFGFQGQRIQFNQFTVNQRGGVVNFASLANLLSGTAQVVDVAVPGRIDPVRGYRQSLIGLFAQDDFRVKPGLTVNMGLRYEFITTPTEVDGKVSNVRTPADADITVGDPWHRNPSLKNFAPRVGIAWDPFGDGKTAVRAGFGVFFDHILPKYYFFSGALNPPFTTRINFARGVNVSQVTLPNILNSPVINTPGVPNGTPIGSLARLPFQTQTINFDIQTPYILQYNLSLQRSLPGNVDVTVAYVGSRGNHLFRIGDANLAPSSIVNGVEVFQPTRGRRNPNFSAILQRATDAQSFYNSLQVSVQKRLSRGLRAQLSYTFSRSVDDASGINSQDFDNVVQYVSNFYNRKLDRGLSAFHVSHNLTFNVTYNLPGQSLTGVKGVFLGGWQVNTITSLRTGAPFTARLAAGFDRAGNLNTVGFAAHQRPNLRQGASNNPVLGGPTRYYDVTAFEIPPAGQLGNLGRNTLIGPGIISVDASVAKSFRFAEGRSLQFRMEFFNLPNRTNFGLPNPVVFNAPSAAVPSGLNPTAGVITTTSTTNRQIQAALKFTF